MEELEMETTEPMPEDQQPADSPAEDATPDQEDSSTGDAAPADGTEDTGTEESPGADPESPEEETGPVDSSAETGSGEDTGTEDQTGEPGMEDPAEDDETEGLPEEPADQTDGTISGNDPGDIITISGNAVIFPEGFDLSQLNGSESSTGDVTALTEAVESQSDLIYSAALIISLLLGVIAGILLINGFRLRRT